MQCHSNCKQYNEYNERNKEIRQKRIQRNEYDKCKFRANYFI